jgi:serine/threonine-protein kinase
MDVDPNPHADTRDREARLATQEHATNVLRFRGALVFGLCSWLAFFPLDVFVARFIEPGPIAWYAGIRAIGAAFIGVLYLATRNPTPRALRFWEQAGYTGFTVLCALLALPFRGLASPYFAGAMVVLFTRGATTAERWPVALRHGVAPVLAYPITLLVACALDPAHRGQLHDGAALASFGLSLAFIVDAFALAAVLGHVVWALRRQIFATRSLGRYRLERRLGAGGMGEVWVAHHAALRRDVALKILRPDPLGASPLAVSRFEREVRATTELVHPNTVRVFDYGVTDDGLWYYAMELLEGEHLGALVEREGPLPAPRAIHLVSQAARALAEAHAKGIVHRDVKPENLFVTTPAGETDVLKVLDFGIAKMDVREDATRLTGTGSVLGTPAYLPPEALRGEPLDARADVYQLGAVLYFLLAGAPPFETTNLAAMVTAHTNEPPVPPSAKRGAPIPPDVEAVVLRCLEKDPTRRYASGVELAQALVECEIAR